MIKNTFLMLDGIGEKSEKSLWKHGVLSWDDYLSTNSLPSCVRGKENLHREMLIFFSEELHHDNPEPFAEFIRRSDHWRLYNHFKDSILYIDIETNGLPAKRGGEITVIGIYDGSELRQYIKGDNLDEESILGEFRSCKMIVSFYGSVFDMPFVRKQFPSLNAINVPHYDLCFAARRVGLRGGLKVIESKLGLRRDHGIENLNGFDAVKLWNRWETGEKKALKTLLYYNAADTKNLKYLGDYIYGELYRLSGFHGLHEKFSHR